MVCCVPLQIFVNNPAVSNPIEVPALRIYDRSNGNITEGSLLFGRLGVLLEQLSEVRNVERHFTDFVMELLQ